MSSKFKNSIVSLIVKFLIFHFLPLSYKIKYVHKISLFNQDISILSSNFPLLWRIWNFSFSSIHPILCLTYQYLSSHIYLHFILKKFLFKGLYDSQTWQRKFNFTNLRLFLLFFIYAQTLQFWYMWKIKFLILLNYS